jgi:hypothetical protein
MKLFKENRNLVGAAFFIERIKFDSLSVKTATKASFTDPEISSHRKEEEEMTARD